MTPTVADRTIAWSDDFLIGIEELDYEHRSLIEDINTLHRNLLEHRQASRIEDTLGKIHARMQAHFALEESVMLAGRYQHYQEHKAEHERLLDDYTEIMFAVAGNPELVDREDVGRRLCRWIVGHILNSDKKMSLLLASGGPS